MKPKLRYRPSASTQWLHCPMAASVSTLEVGLHDTFKEPDHGYTSDGHKAHEYLEHLLSAPSVDAEEISSQMKGLVRRKHPDMPDESVRLLELVADDVWSLKVIGDYDIHVEIKVPIRYGEWETEGGTVDILLHKPGFAFVLDLKWGEGVAVEVVRNPQLTNYALGVTQLYPDVRQLTLGVYQPRGNGAGLEFWDVSLEGLADHETKAAEAIRLSETATDVGDYVPGKHCFWCRGRRKGLCPRILHETVMAAAAHATGAVVGDDLPVAEYPFWVLDYEDQIRGLLKGVGEKADNMLSRGERVPGWALKRVEGRSEWAVPEEVPPMLASELGGAPGDYERREVKPITITEAKKVAKRMGKVTVVDAMTKKKEKTVRFRVSDDDTNIPALFEPVE